MNLWRSLTRGLRALTHRAEADAQASDEIEHYVQLAAAEHLRRGLSPELAQRSARLEVGNPTVAREAIRSFGWEHAVETLAGDVHYALRRLRHNPGFTIVAVLTLGLGLGSATAIFSAIHPILLAPLPYPNASRLVTVADRRSDGTPAAPTFGTYTELVARSRAFESLAAIDRWQPSLTGTNDPERFAGERVSASYFRTLGVRPAIGRDFTASDDVVGGTRVAILSDRLARRRFAGGQALVGRTIELDGVEYVIIGVMPASFTNILASSADIWTPMQRRANAPFNSVEWGHHYQIVGRIRGGASVAGAADDIAAVARARMPEFARPPWADLSNGFLVRPMRDDVTHDARPALLAIVGAVLVLLAIASVNVANLLLAQRGRRRGELALRSALGAGQWRLARQQVTECLVLALIGGVVGLAFARVGVRALIALAPPGLPRVDSIGFDGAVFAFAFVATTVIGLVIGFSSTAGLRREGGGLRANLQESSTRTAGGRTAARRVLVVAEVALAIVLLASAGLLMRSLDRLFAVDPGFDASHLLTMQVVEAGPRDRSDTARRQFFEQALDAVRQVPGVSAAAFTSQLPLSDELDGYGFEIQSKPSTSPGDDGSALRYAVTPGYFHAMRIPLRRGRVLDDRDRPGAPEAVVISESLARRLFGARDPIGQRFRFGPEAGSTRPWDEVVGVVGDVKQQSLAASQTDAFYVGMGQWWRVDDVQSIVVRAAGDPSVLAPSVKRAIWSVDANHPIQRVATMDRLIAITASQRRFALAIIETFALAALALAAIGLYGVVAGSVSERTREIGIRVALGAAPRGIVRSIVGGAVSLAGVGTVLGLIGAGLASSLLQTLLFGISRLDPMTYVGVAMLLAAVAAIASWGPARRASRVDPAVTLRAE